MFDNIELITQAVILAGGRGERLKPLTDSTPKPMVDINGKPFIWYLCKQLADQGVKEILILSGYLSEVVENWARQTDLAKSVSLKVIPSAAEWDPIDRLRLIQDKVQDRFLLLYGDNFISCNYKKINSFSRANSESAVSLVINSKSPGNIQPVNSSGLIQYSQKRQDSCNFVDLGFMTIKSAKFFELSQNSKSLSAALEYISEQGKLSGLEYPGCYYSISDYQRYMQTAEFLKPKKFIILDRDGTINSKATSGYYVTRAEDLHILESAKAGIKKLAANGYSFAIISNQAGLSTGDISESAMSDINQKLQTEFQSISAKLEDILICPAHWQEKLHPDRKPQAGLFYKLSEKYQLRLDDTFYIGDDPRDVEAAWNANCLSAYIGDPASLSELNDLQKPTVIAENFEDAADQILAYYSSSKFST